MSDKPTIIFAGTPEFAAVQLAALLSAGYKPALVLTQPDRPRGRGQKLSACPVKALALLAGCHVQTPISFKDPQTLQLIESMQADLMIVSAYGHILPKSVLKMPKHGCWNIHPSLLPKRRGATPIQHAILEGADETGVCLMQLDSKMDAGDILLSSSYALNGDITSGLLSEAMAKEGATLLLKGLSDISYTVSQAVPQDHRQATYTHKIEKEHAHLDFTQDAHTIDRQIRAYNPQPVAYASLEGLRIRIWSAMMTTAPSLSAPGTIECIEDNGIMVATATTLLSLKQCQIPGKTVQDVTQLLSTKQCPFKIGAQFK